MIDQYPDFLPRWTEAIQQVNKNILGIIPPCNSSRTASDKIEKRFDLNWSSGSCCLTGEAFFFQHAPTNRCTKCYDFTYESFDILKSPEKLYQFKIELAEHLQARHEDTWQQWKNKK